MSALSVVLAVVFVLFGGALGCILAGADRIVTARMQGRQGPSILQPYYDVRKLLEKDPKASEPAMNLLCGLSLVFAVVAGAVFFAGGNFLLVVFTVTLSSLLFILAAYLNSSPYAQIGAQREVLQVMCYEPMVLFVAVGLYLATGSFEVKALFANASSLVVWEPLVFLGLVFVLTIKLRKSPFDLSMAHHAHQEIVRGTTTEMSGRTLALVEITHWYENVLFLGWVGMFFVNGNPWSVVLAVLVVAVVWFLEILIDNNFARVKWQVMFKGAWGVALVAGVVNFALFYFVSSGGVIIF
jgi:ech hydrogenase subunit B